MEEYKRIDRKLIHKGQIIDVYADTIELPGGHHAVWDYIHHKGAAAMLAVDTDGKLVMVRQYRNAIGCFTLEIPAGGLNQGEDMMKCAIRELEEETGYHAESAKPLLKLHTTVAFCNELIGIYYSESLTKTVCHLDDDEFVDVEKHSLEDLVAMIYRGEIVDGKTIAAILAYKDKKHMS